MTGLALETEIQAAHHTCSRTGEGWRNLAGHKDLLTGEIVGQVVGDDSG